MPATFEGVGPFDVVSLDNVQTYDDGTVSVDFVYGGFFNGPGGVTAERWYLVEEDGDLKVDNITQISMPEGVPCGRDRRRGANGRLRLRPQPDDPAGRHADYLPPDQRE